SGSAVALRVTVSHFEKTNYRKSHFSPRAQMFLESGADDRAAPIDQRDDDIRVQTDHSSKNLRGSGLDGGSSGGPSTNNSSPPRASISAQKASESNFFGFLTGSKITLSPILLTRASLPGRR